MKKESFLRKFIREQCDKIDQNVINSHMGKTAFSLRDVEEQEEIYIYKPWKFIFHLLMIHFMRFGVLTLVSFFPLVFFVVPAWALVIYEFYITLKLMKKYNLSIIKITIFSVIIELGFCVVSPFLRSGIKWIFFRLVSGNLFA